MKKFLMCSVFLMLSFMVFATGQNEESKDGQIKIGIVNLSQGPPYFIAMSKAIEDEAKSNPNVTVYVTDANGDQAKLTSDVEDILAKNVDGIIISGGWFEDAPAALDMIEEAGVPVVLVDRRYASDNFTSWIGPDNYSIGQQTGKYIVEKLNGKGRIIIIKGGPADNSIGYNRSNGVKDIVSKTDIEIIEAPEYAGWGAAGGQSQMQDLLAKYDSIDWVFCENDSMALGAQQAIQDSDRSSEIMISGVDGEKAALSAIMKDGSNYATTGLNDADAIGRAGYKRLMSILAGDEPQYETVFNSPLITSENAEEYYNAESIF
ncbi:MAG: substrate-binding domain-containing protein [Spirochaetaceae bacterium]